MKRLPDSYFAQIYAADADPWGFATRWYEQRKYALTLAALPNAHYARAFEPGCAFGVLTELLAARCTQLIASEVVPEVAERARRRLQPHAHVKVVTAAIPDHLPEGNFDLVVLSEVLYYLSEHGLAELLAYLEQHSDEQGHLLAVHYRGATDYPLSGDAVHALLRARPAWRPLAHYEEDNFVLDLFTRSST